MSDTDIAQKCREAANDLYDPRGKTMDRWDQIRHQIETMRGSDAPRINFEAMTEDWADLFEDAHQEILRLIAEVERLNDQCRGMREADDACILRLEESIATLRELRTYDAATITQLKLENEGLLRALEKMK